MSRSFGCFVIILFLTVAAGAQQKFYDKPVKFIDKPAASYPSQKNGAVCTQGTVTLRVQFLESGEIGKIVVVSGLPNGFNEKAVEAARKIKFQPATKDGKPISISKQVQYSFSLY